MTIHVTDHARKRLKTRLSGHMQRPGRFIDLAYQKGLVVLSDGSDGFIHKLYQGVIYIFRHLRLITVYPVDFEQVISYARFNVKINLKGVS